MIYKVTSRVARWGRLLFLSLFGCSRSHLPARNKKLLLLTSALYILTATQSANAIQLSSDAQLVTAGYFQLLWSGNARQFQLQESSSENFNSYKVLYEGSDLARVMSGKSNGDYFYRVVNKENTSVISNTVKVTVSHHSLKNAILFFIAGAIVFIFTVILIIKGNQQVNS